ncbi:phage holin family protein [Bythopirellula goksoeyrii]|uniref:Phage holin family protein n=1 Tax=Bythopirellula goksoeyrii TaxID=1400387 RepID=A0A5B9QDE8_9BACT|nr:phage holin family protein [Bythopirellula goksoeyrii]QEG36924.1 hypothetical protein Pr1d_42640 [Bythopirellula goksoeyrii]
MNNSNGASGKASQPHVTKSFSKLAHDAIELAELQVKLFKLDSRDAGRDMRATMILSAIGLVLLLACLPVVLLAGAEALVEYSQWSHFEALSIVAAGSLVLCVILGAISWWKLKKGLTSWQRSNEELSRNVAWLKSTLSNNSQATSKTQAATSRI